MSFQPVVPFGGVVGLQYLRRTMDIQREAFDASPVLKRDVDYFRENIASVTSAEDLVSNRQMLKVALGAFGLDGDLDSKFLIRKVLEEGVTSPEALANRLSDTRYRELSKAFGFGNGTLPNTGLSGFAERITSAYLQRQFEVGVGASDNNLRLALSFEREIPEIAQRSTSDETKWFTVMGNRPLRQVFETAFGLPTAFGTLDLDRQLDTFRDRAERFLGISEFSDLADPETQNRLVQLFLTRAQLAQGPSLSAAGSGASVALTLLSQTASPGLLSLR
jgi:hypothetical protein